MPTSDPALLINILRPTETEAMPTQDPALEILAAIASHDRAEASREIRSLINLLTLAEERLADDEDLSWYANGVDHAKANSAMIRAAASREALRKARGAVDFANRAGAGS